MDVKKETYEGGSECDDVTSITSSTCASVLNGLHTSKGSNNGIKCRNNNKKLLKNVRSMQRRAKSRTVRPYADVSYSQDSAIHESGQSPNYLKATNSSEGKKLNFSSSNGSVNDGSELNSSSHSSPIHGSMRSMSKKASVSSVRNVGILLRKTSFKPKRLPLAYSQVSEDASVDRATYSSTVKDSKFPKPVEIPLAEAEPESSPAMKICRYHHCSLHGHCHGTSDSVPPPKRFQYRKRTSLKKQKSIRPRRESDSKTKFSKEKKKIVERKMSGSSALASGAVNEKSFDSYKETHPEDMNQSFGDGYLDLKELGLLEIAFGEMSFPERSFRETLEILDKHSVKKQELGRSGSGLKGYCLKCSNSITEQIMSPLQNADIDLVCADRSADTHSLALNEKHQEQVVSHIDDTATFDEQGYANEESDKDSPDTPIIFDTLRKNHGLNSSASHSRATSDNNSMVDGEFIAESSALGFSNQDSDVQVQDSEIQAPTIKGSILQFSKPRHISMWHLIHEHMSSDSAAEAEKKPDESMGGKGQDGVDGQVPTNEASESDMIMESNGSEVQEIELRKLFAIKLVREAIEKILLPEVQDQTSDDQSVTSETTPRSEVIEKNQSDVFDQESYRESGAAKMEEVKSDTKEDTVIADVASGTDVHQSGNIAVGVPKKKAPRHWSNLKKWILLQKFIRELEKVRTFNPRKPRHLPLSPDPEAEKINLRAQTVDGKKRSEEWMLDYALQQAVSQLAPTQKRKVALLVRAFETVVPSQEEPQNPTRIPSFKILELVSEGIGSKKAVTFIGNNKLTCSDTASSLSFEVQDSSTKLTDKSTSYLNGRIETKSTTDEYMLSSIEGSAKTDCGNGEGSLETQSLISDGNGKSEMSQKLRSSDSFGTQLDMIVAEETKTPADQGESREENKPENAVSEKQNRVKMWHMIYQHVVSGIAEKVGNKILEGSDDDEVEESESGSPSSTTNGFPKSKDHVQENDIVSSNQRSAFLKLVKDAVDEILLPETPDDSADTRSPRSETSPAHETNKFEPQKSKNWSKLKKHLVLQRSIRALQMGGKPKPKPQPMEPQMPNPEPEKIDLRNQMMDERKKAEQWMLDYAVQHIVTKLTPARKRRVSMLVEAFEAVVPLPET